MKASTTFILLFIACSAFSQTTYTLSSSCLSDGDCSWEVGSSWEGGIAPVGGTPVAGSTIIIPASRYVSIPGGSGISITNEVTIQIYGTLDIETPSAELVLNSANSLVQIDAGATVLGGNNSTRITIDGNGIRGSQIDDLLTPNQLTATTLASNGGCAELGGCNDDPLPVELANFVGERSVQGNALSWSTATELNNDYFSIQRSEDGSFFYSIGKIDGSGTTSTQQYYSFVDSSPIASIEYYRLVQFDFDGASEVHKTILIQSDNYEAFRPSVNVSPNPASTNVTLTSSIPLTYEYLHLVDLAGRVVADLAVDGGGVESSARLPDIKGGMYYLQYGTTTGQSGALRLLVR